MSCGGGCNNGKCGRPREEFAVNPAVLQAAIKNLYSVAATGIKNFPWPNDEIAALAELIASVLAENEQLKKLLGRREPVTPRPGYDGEWVRLALGPNNAYTLTLPAGTPVQRAELATSLMALAVELRKSSNSKLALPGQLTFQFDE